MANYCYNILTVTGPAAEARRFKDLVTEGQQHLEFKKTVPCPPQLDNDKNKNDLPTNIRAAYKATYGHDNWYDWQLANWGCKWGPYEDVDAPQEQIYKNGKMKLVYMFDTPWSPPSEWVRNTSKLFPVLKFSNYCDEPGNGFRGTETFINGKLTKDTIKNT